MTTDAIVTDPHAPEDVERQPDGIPHRVIGITALLSVILAIVVLGVVATRSTLGLVLAVLIALVAIPVLVSRMRTVAARDRDESHPSR